MCAGWVKPGTASAAGCVRIIHPSSQLDSRIMYNTYYYYLIRNTRIMYYATLGRRGANKKEVEERASEPSIWPTRADSRGQRAAESSAESSVESSAVNSVS